MNPEFRRNLWLEATQHRMLITPLVLAGIFYLTYLVNDSHFGIKVAHVAETIAVLFCIVWGASLAADSLITEVRGGTWENQRMSALTPWQLAWGKLFGGTIMAWYGAMICLAVYAVSAGSTPLAAAKIVLIVLLAGIFTQSVSLLSVIYALRKDRALTRMRAGLFSLMGLFLVYPLVPMVAGKQETLHWYGAEWSHTNFMLCSLAVFAAWALIGLDRSMRTELQVRNSCWVWAAFVVWLMAYSAGFANPASLGVGSRVEVACFIGFVLFYAMIFVESKDPVHFSRLLSAVRDRNWQALQLLLPNWATTLVLTMLAVGLLLAIDQGDSKVSGSMLCLTALFFALRDLCIILALNFGKRRNRADMAAIIYLAILYGLLPWIMVELFHAQALILFYPRPLADIGSVQAIMAALVEAALAFWMMRRRWRENYAVVRLQAEKE